ncbi:MAG: D-aminoacyl-tRNA deacylase [Acutalibacteraceae bacterium]
MKAVIQRVTEASVKVDGEVKGEIKNGFLILLGVEQGDNEACAQVLAKKIYGLRIFNDNEGKMNLSLPDINGEALVISQFTLLADCVKGRRPSFIKAEKPEKANALYEYFCTLLTSMGLNRVEKGVFGADMKVSLLNDGPVTIILDSKELLKC